ncbi:TPA: hypothetical protein DEG75_04535 [Candidatus Dependentiae bacterium]|nr:hypothetical protein [Candidatus Dependentiae bacterium]
MNKKYILFAFALFACFGHLKNLNATKPIANDSCMYRSKESGPSANHILNYFGKEDRIAYDMPKYLLREICFESLKFKADDTRKLNGVLTKCTGLEALSLAESKGIDFTKLNWTNCKNLNMLNLHSTDIDVASLKKILIGCPNLKKLNLFGCEKLDEKYRNYYQTKEEVERLKKDLGLENQKSLPINPKPSWLVAKWQALSTPWKWALGLGAVAIPLIGACIFYKKSHSIKNLSGAIWYRLAPLLKRQKTVNQPLKLHIT